MEMSETFSKLHIVLFPGDMGLYSLPQEARAPHSIGNMDEKDWRDPHRPNPETDRTRHGHGALEPRLYAPCALARSLIHDLLSLLPRLLPRRHAHGARPVFVHPSHEPLVPRGLEPHAAKTTFTRGIRELQRRRRRKWKTYGQAKIRGRRHGVRELSVPLPAPQLPRTSRLRTASLPWRNDSSAIARE